MKTPNPYYFFVALARFIWAHLKGEKVFTPPIVELARLGECENGCPWFDPEARQCTACTCFVDLKCCIATEKCPKGRWGRYWGKPH